jgi:hypothetical protein
MTVSGDAAETGLSKPLGDTTKTAADSTESLHGMKPTMSPSGTSTVDVASHETTDGPAPASQSLGDTAVAAGVSPDTIDVTTPVPDSNSPNDTETNDPTNLTTRTMVWTLHEPLVIRY